MDTVLVWTDWLRVSRTTRSCICGAETPAARLRICQLKNEVSTSGLKAQHRSEVTSGLKNLLVGGAAGEMVKINSTSANPFTKYGTRLLMEIDRIFFFLKKLE